MYGSGFQHGGAFSMQARRQFDTGVHAGRNDAALKRAEPSRPGRLPSRTARSLAAVLLVAFAAILGLPPQAEAQTGICGRTAAVRTGILGKISGVSNCANVTDAHLAAITGTLNLSAKGITALAAGDFDGLTALTTLYLGVNRGALLAHDSDHASRRGVRRADLADEAGSGQQLSVHASRRGVRRADRVGGARCI